MPLKEQITKIIGQPVSQLTPLRSYLKSEKRPARVDEWIGNLTQVT